MSKQIEAGKKFNLQQSMAYSDGAVVSKTIIKKSTGNVTLFSFDAGEGLTEHTSPFEALVQVVDGSVEITIGEEPVTVSAGECIILPANIPHSLKATEKFMMLLIMIKG